MALRPAYAPWLRCNYYLTPCALCTPLASPPRLCPLTRGPPFLLVYASSALRESSACRMTCGDECASPCSFAGACPSPLRAVVAHALPADTAVPPICHPARVEGRARGWDARASA
ncbi:hypothetical protein C8R44DRAFT_771893 [Mycena epipterygia]|nr:hypothetical protein C8R44DRAFT_771893 [Mycena epipterygia]